MELKNTLKEIRLTNYLINQIRNLQFNICPSIFYKIIFNYKKFLRVVRIDRQSCYEKLRTIKNKNKGERCFIVATGPSLKISDLEKLKSEVTFSMNSICLAFDQTDWRPTYYGIQGIHVYKQLEDYVENMEIKGKFFGDTIPLNNVSEKDYIYPLNMLNHAYPHKKYKSKFSRNAFAQVYDGYSITYSLIQIAVYMGFKEIYLLGVDCNYTKDMNHHFKEYGHVDPTFLSAGDRMLAAFKEAKKSADRYKIKIYNATRGGMLEIFERVNLDDVLKNQNLKTKRQST